MFFYLIGIKGSGMSALANILFDEGHVVRGMDVDHFVFTQKLLLEKGISIDQMDYHQFSEVDCFIIGHDFMKHEVMKIIETSGKQIYEYHHFVAKYALEKYAIAIAGTHGKTTTTGMMYQILQSFENVSLLRGDGVGKSHHGSTHFVFEACEYKNHFHVYHPQCVIITNIDYDHVDFFPTIEEYQKSFNDFIKNCPQVFIEYEDKDKISHSQKITYGVSDEADYYGKDYHFSTDGVTFSFFKRGIFLGRFSIPVHGLHNLKHAIAIGAFMHCHNYSLHQAFIQLVNFTGVKRRMETKIINDDVFIDDYAHHPREIEATLDAVREIYPNQIINVIFKPDRYSRLMAFIEEFKKALQKADRAYVVSLYERRPGYQDSNILTIDTQVRFVAENVPENYNFDERKSQVFVFMSSKNMNDYIDMVVKIRQEKH